MSNKKKHIKNRKKYDSHHGKKTVYNNTFVIGKLSILKNGRAFVAYEPSAKDIEVPMEHIANAMHSDTVKVELINKLSSGRIKGKIVEVVNRGQNTYIGTVEQKGKQLFFNADTSYILPVFLIDTSTSIRFKDGDQVVAKWLNWEYGKFPKVSIIEVCKNWSITKLTYRQLLYEQQFNTGFSDALIQKVKQIGITNQDKQNAYRKDFRDTFTITIDPQDAKDFDDAISFKKLENGLLEVGVHIADVTHFIEENSVLDKVACKRSTSVYMPGVVEPMLPEHLSNNICSLVPHEDRLCFAIIFTLTSEGKIQSYDITKTTICSNRRFTYEEVQTILETKTGSYFDILSTLNVIAQLWRTKRIKQGSIDFQPSEKNILLKPNQEVDKVVLSSSNHSHQLIEEFMLMANKYVAMHLSSKHPNVLFPSRVHDVPNEEKLKVFANFAKSFNYLIEVNPKKLPDSLNKMIQSEIVKNTNSPLPTLAIRVMSKAQYAIDSIGHYGLGFQHYAHFTSPIRRYPDVLLHRILFATLNRKQVVNTKLENQCKYCNERERAAMEIEREARKFKIVEFMQPFVGHTFDAMITGVSERGIWAETTEHFAEGFIPISNLNLVEPFKCLSDLYLMKGLHSGRKLKMGDVIKIRLLRASLETRKIDFEWITPST